MDDKISRVWYCVSGTYPHGGSPAMILRVPSCITYSGGAPIRTTARSVAGSSPTRSAGTRRPSARVTKMLPGVMHDMAICQDETIRSKNEARARTARLGSQARIGP
jgi:hypothetical protein